MKHVVLLLWHENVDALIRLVNFFDDDFSFYIHIDKKSKINNKEITRLQEMKQVHKIYRKYKINWGGFNILKAEIFLLKEIVKNNVFDYIHFMSGSDYPIKKIEKMKSFFEENNGWEFIEYMRLPVEQWEKGSYARFNYYRFLDYFNYRTDSGAKVIDHIIRFQQKIGYKRRIPDQFDYLYGGSNWMSITLACAKYIIEQYKKNLRFYRRLKYTFAPDEVYFHTVILNSPLKGKVRNDNLRLILWEYNHSSFPAILDEKYWWQIITTKALFARKFNTPISGKLINLIDTIILKDEPIPILSQGYWKSDTLAGHCYDTGLANGLLNILSYMEVESLADFGCGPGWYVSLLRRNGYDAYGYDGNPNIEELSSLLFTDGYYCHRVDLTEELEAEVPFDVVLCLEVGEHIPKEYEDIFIMNIIRNSGKYIIFSWAIEGQHGDGHVNCHSNDYIISKISMHGFYLNRPLSNYLRNSSVLWWFKNTIMVFERRC